MKKGFDMKQTTRTDIRIPKDLHDRISDHAEDAGASKNSMIGILLTLGLRAYEGNITLQEREK